MKYWVRETKLIKYMVECRATMIRMIEIYYNKLACLIVWNRACIVLWYLSQYVFPKHMLLGRQICVYEELLLIHFNGGSAAICLCDAIAYVQPDIPPTYFIKCNYLMWYRQFLLLEGSQPCGPVHLKYLSFGFFFYYLSIGTFPQVEISKVDS